MGFVQELAVGLRENRALLVLSLKDNRLATKEGGEVLAHALANNSTLKELDVSSNNWRSNEHVMWEGDGAGFAQELAVVMKDNGALSITNVIGNSIGKEIISKLQEIMRSKPNLVSLCGVADEATEADLSGLGVDADAAVILASELPDKGALSFLNLANNSLMRGKIKPSDGSSAEWWAKQDSSYETNVSGIVALANAIPDMGALLRLDMSNNEINCDIHAEAAAVPGKALSDALAANTVLTQLDLSKNYLKPEFVRELAVGIRDKGA
jgi:Ran GTPase-activating protein (RanGAP) involved in mRNA processing and transport